MKKILAALLLLSFFACTPGQDDDIDPGPPVVTDTLSDGWSKVSTNQNPVDIFFVGNTGFTAGNSRINRSKDGGKTWDSVFYRSTATFFLNISMGDVNKAIFTILSLPGATSSELIRTMNGGNSFDTVYIADGSVSNIFFVSPSVVYAIGRKCWKSVDAGTSWQQLYDFGAAAVSNYKGLFFLNEQIGWATGADGLYKTSNGGVNWQLISTPSFNFSFGGNVFFSDANTGYAADSVGAGKSTNGGTSWVVQKTLAPLYHDIHFVTNDIGYLTSDNYILKTTDGGATWKNEVVLHNNSIKFYELHFTDANHGWACGENGLILRYER